MDRDKRMVYENSTILAVELLARYPVLASINRRYFFLSILLELSTGYIVPFLKGNGYHTYLAITMLSTPSTGSLRINKACSPWDSDRGHQHPQLTSILAQIYQTDMDPNQISATNAGTRPIILSCRHIYLLYRHNQPQPTWYPTKYLQQTLGLPWSQSRLCQLCLHMPKLLPTFPTDPTSALIISKRRYGSMKYFQLTPGLLKPKT